MLTSQKCVICGAGCNIQRDANCCDSCVDWYLQNNNRTIINRCDCRECLFYKGKWKKEGNKKYKSVYGMMSKKISRGAGLCCPTCQEGMIPIEASLGHRITDPRELMWASHCCPKTYRTRKGPQIKYVGCYEINNNLGRAFAFARGNSPSWLWLIPINLSTSKISIANTKLTLKTIAECEFIEMRICNGTPMPKASAAIELYNIVQNQAAFSSIKDKKPGNPPLYRNHNSKGHILVFGTYLSGIDTYIRYINLKVLNQLPTKFPEQDSKCKEFVNLIKFIIEGNKCKQGGSRAHIANARDIFCKKVQKICPQSGTHTEHYAFIFFMVKYGYCKMQEEMKNDEYWVAEGIKSSVKIGEAIQTMEKTLSQTKDFKKLAENKDCPILSAIKKFKIFSEIGDEKEKREKSTSKLDIAILYRYLSHIIKELQSKLSGSLSNVDPTTNSLGKYGDHIMWLYIFFRSVEMGPTNCWDPEALVTSSGQGRLGNGFPITSVSGAYRSIAEYLTGSTSNISFENPEKPNEEEFTCWKYSEIPINFNPIFRYLLSNQEPKENPHNGKAKDKEIGKQDNTCHHPVLCELGPTKKTSHTCCRPSHLILARPHFNTMNTSLQRAIAMKKFGIEEPGSDLTKDFALLERIELCRSFKLTNIKPKSHNK